MQAFTRAQRLLSSKQFQNVFSKAKRVATPHFLILVRKNNDEVARLGLVISKKNVAKANKRNLIKRLCRESFRMQAIGSKDVIVLARKNMDKLSRTELREKLDKAWVKVTAI